MKQRWPELRWLLLWLTVVTLLAACAKSPTPAATTDAPQAVATSTPPSAETPPKASSILYTIGKPRPSTFAVYEPEPVTGGPNAPAYNLDPNAVVNRDLLARLTPAQQARLAENGFVVVPSGIEQIYQVYKEAKDSGTPIFVTTDSLLHTHHVLYDYALRLAELQHFVADLKGLNAAMFAAAQEQHANTTGSVKEAARRNVAFFGVASVLLEPETPVPADVADLITAELTLIDAHAGLVNSPIFEFKEDYSQYVPRGHYTRNETFERYFRSMMWYGRIGFQLRPGETPEMIEMGRRETRQAILISAALSTAEVGGEPALDVWERIYEPTAFFVGKADDLTIYDYLEVIRQIYGRTLNLADLAMMLSSIVLSPLPPGCARPRSWGAMSPTRKTPLSSLRASASWANASSPTATPSSNWSMTRWARQTTPASSPRVWM